jgi:hypothetical protein
MKSTNHRRCFVAKMCSHKPDSHQGQNIFSGWSTLSYNASYTWRRRRCCTSIVGDVVYYSTTVHVPHYVSKMCLPAWRFRFISNVGSVPFRSKQACICYFRKGGEMKLTMHPPYLCQSECGWPRCDREYLYRHSDRGPAYVIYIWVTKVKKVTCWCPLLSSYLTAPPT